MKKEKLKRIARRITAFAAAAAMAATFTFPAEVGDGFFDSFDNAIVASAETVNFAVTGGTEGTDYSYAENVLTILKETPLTISGTTTTDRIEVAYGVSANITLAGVNIDVSSLSDTAAFKIADGSTGNVTITLADGSENTLISGGNCAGLQKNGDAEGIGKLTIKGGTNGTGKLTAAGGYLGAGVGGGDWASGSNITISGGTVTATGGSSGAGIGGGGDYGSCSNITISGGTVTATGGSAGAGIGGGDYGSGSAITISGGTVTATGGSSGAGIGGGDYGFGSAITISGGTVTATGGSDGAGIGGGNFGYGSDITISGGSVKAVRGSCANAIGGGMDNGAVIPTNGTGNVYLLELDVDGTSAVTINGNANYPTKHINENKLYVYLPAGIYAVANGNSQKTYTIADDGTVSEVVVVTAFTITGTDLVYGTDYTYPADTGVLTILSDKAITIKNTNNGSTTNRIEVAYGVSANITLAGVNIDVSSLSDTAAFKIADNSTGNVTITLADGTENTLKSGLYCAGLQKNGNAEGIGNLTINGGTNGTGKLTATGGFNGAGIGGGYDQSGSDITISGGTITATGDDSGAGIGGGRLGSGSDITISGGTVTATGGKYGAGIGGGSEGYGLAITISGGVVTANGSKYGAGIGGGHTKDGSNITISGGTVTATGGNYGAGIGGGSEGSGSAITISGGTVTATGGEYGAGIGGGRNGSGSNLEITGGSVKAVAGGNANAIGGGSGGNGAVIPTLAGGSTNVYLLTIENPDGKDVFIDGSTTPYKPSNHSAAGTGDTNLYAYLTGETHKVKIGDEETEYKFDTNKFLPVPKAIYFTFTAPTDLVYDGNAKTATVEAKNGITGIGTITVKYYDADGNRLDSAPVVPGTYTVKIDVTAGTNYAAVTDLTADSWKFSIDKATPNVTAPTATAITYGQTLSASTLSDANWSWVDGTVIPTVENSGYAAKITVDDSNSNYDYSGVEGYDSTNHTVTRTIAVTVNKATPNVTAPTAAAITYGQALSASTLSDANWSWVDGTIVPTVKNSGYAAKMTVDDSNYDYSDVEGYDSTKHTVTRAIAVTVNKATPNVTAPTAAAITYGQALSASTLSDANWSWVDGTVIPTVENSGYAAKMIVDDSNYDYSGVEGYDSTSHTVTRTISVTVTPAQAKVVTAPTAIDKLVFDGNEKALVSAGTASGGTMVYSLDGVSFSETIPTATAAGTYTVHYKASGDANHTDSEVGKVSVTIESAAEIITSITVSKTAVVVTYGYEGTTITARTENVAFADVTVEMVDWMKNSNIQLVIDFVNYSTAGSDTIILTSAQMKAIEYVLEHDLGM